MTPIQRLEQREKQIESMAEHQMIQRIIKNEEETAWIKAEWKKRYGAEYPHMKGVTC